MNAVAREESVTQRQYAIHRGVSPPSVLRAIRAGRLKKAVVRKPDGTLGILVSVADREWALQTDLTKPRNSVTGRPKARKPGPGFSLPMGVDPPESSPANGNGGGRHDPLVSQIAAAQAVVIHFKARQARLDFERAEGKLVDATEVRSAMFTAIKSVKFILAAMAARIAPVVGGMDKHQARVAIDKEVARAIAELTKLSKAKLGS